MSTQDVAGVILAAGEGTRMRSSIAKVLHAVGGMTMIDHVLHTLEAAGVTKNIVVTGHAEEQVKAHIHGRAKTVTQAERKGTGHAVMQAENALKDFKGLVLITCGDAPLWRTDTIRSAITRAQDEHISGLVVTTRLDDPTGYGRIIRDDEGKVERIVEQKDATEDEARVAEINSGTYCFRSELLFDALHQVKSDNAQGEYYLTDVIGILIRQGHRIEAFRVPDHGEAMGVNSRFDLAEAEAALQRRLARRLMDRGVTIVDPRSTWVDFRAEVGRDTVIYPNTILRGKTVVGERCRIGPNTELIDANIGEGTTVRHSVVEGASVAAGSNVGPFQKLGSA